MRILWLSNRVLEDTKDTRSGTWLTSFAPRLTKQDDIQLGNISTGNVKSMVRQDYQTISQWIVPNESRKKNGLPSRKTITAIQEAADIFKPDIIQIWGTENYWGLLTARGYLNGKSILNIQGLISSIYPVVYGGLNFKELIQCFGIKELVRPGNSLYALKNRFKKRILFEQEIIAAHKFIVTQSSWTEGQIIDKANSAKIFSTERNLRKEFLGAKNWISCSDLRIGPEYTLFTSCGGHPYKGIHVLIRAFAEIHKRMPNVTLNIGGATSKEGIRRSGYEKWLRKLARSLGVAKHINWLGPLQADQIILQLQKASVFIHPSFIESYSLTFAEAMYIGTPSVVSYAGAMPTLANDNESALFFTPNDHKTCAFKVEKLLKDSKLSIKLSTNAVRISKIRNQPSSIIANQISIYKQVYYDEKSGKN